MVAHSLVRVLILAVLALGAAAVVVLATSQVTFAQSSSDGGGGGCVLGPLCGLGDLGAWLQQTVTTILTDVLTSLATDFGHAIIGFVDDVNVITHTPENLSYHNDLVQQFATAMQVLADALFAVVVLVSGYNVMLRPYLGSSYASTLEVLPRLLLGGILINTAGWCAAWRST